MEYLSQKQQLKSYFKKVHNRDLSDAEILEITESLYYFAKAKLAYHQQKEEVVNDK